MAPIVFYKGSDSITIMIRDAHLKGAEFDQDVSSADTVSMGSPGCVTRTTKLYYQSSSEGAEFSVQYQVSPKTTVQRERPPKKSPSTSVPPVNEDNVSFQAVFFVGQKVAVIRPDPHGP